MAEVSRTFTLDSAHFLPNYPGKCSRLHGHTWTIRITVSGKTQPKVGMVMDFSLLKNLVIVPLEDKFDHYVLNEKSPFDLKDFPPTAENIGKHILTFAQEVLGTVKVSKVEVWETPNSLATIYPEDC
jgi:6-pyruvoyltetrahydropterin/6-carboxytetrahydropterin synthase